MSPLTTVVTQILSVLTVLANLGVALILLAFLGRKNPQGQKALAFLNKNAILFTFIIAMVATLGSLFYSNIAGFVPCVLCWWQRIFMYPQAVILGIALWKKDRSVAAYALGLAIPGAIIAGYHYYIQLGGSPLVPCSYGFNNSCEQRPFMTFGYITIPFMALSAFVLNILLILTLKFKNDK